MHWVVAFVANLTGLWEPAFTGVLILLGIEIRVKGAYLHLMRQNNHRQKEGGVNSASF
jgi:hypothetical protein